MGTMLYAKGIFLNRCFDELNLSQPDLVAEVHQEYVRAGADVIETNTFGANRVKMMWSLCGKAVEQARQHWCCQATDSVLGSAS